MQLWDALRKWEDTTADWEFQVSTRDILPRKPNVRVSKFNRGFTGFSQCEIQVFSTLNPEDMEKEIQAALKVSAIHVYISIVRQEYFNPGWQEASRMYNKKEDPVALRFKVHPTLFLGEVIFTKTWY